MKKKYEVLSDDVVERIAAHVATRLLKECGLPTCYDKEDLFQEIRALACNRKRHIDPSYEPRQQNVFLVRGVYLEALERLYYGNCKSSRSKQVPTVPLSELKRTAETLRAKSSRPETEVDARLDAQRVWQAVDEVGAPRETHYFKDYYQLGLTTTQIAKRHGVSVSAVTSCMKRIKRKLNDYFSFPEKREGMILLKKQRL